MTVRTDKPLPRLALGTLAPNVEPELVQWAQCLLDRFNDQKGIVGEGKEPVTLVSPGCDEGCDVCYRSCAIRGILARAAIHTLSRAQAKATALSHNGVTYAEPMGRA